MTCIVGLIHDGKTYIGGDAAGSSSQSGAMTIRSQSKVFYKGEFILGFTSSFRMGDLLEWTMPAPQEKNGLGDLRGHLITTWIPEIRNWFKHHGYLHTDKGVESGGTFLIGYKGKLCVIYDDFQVGESVDGYLSVGSGGSIALGVLFATKQSKMNPNNRVILALKAAAYHNACVREPFTVIQS